MHYRLFAALAAATIVLGAAPAAASKGPKPLAPRRAAGHTTLHLSRHDLMSGGTLTVRGRVLPAGAHLVKIVLRGPDGNLAHTRTERDGRFRISLSPAAIGTYAVRAFGVHGPRISSSHSPWRRLTVYRRALASYYGPGLYGSGVACGGTLMPGTLGVANRTLPCGTMVNLRYHGHSVTVPVIDRGPYVAGREFDLTEATRQRLHFPGLGVVLASR